MPHICPTCQIVNVQIWDSYISIYTSYTLNAINNVTRSTDIHTFHILVYAFSAYRPNIIVHIKKQQNATLIYHTFAIHVPTTNMPPKCHIYNRQPAGNAKVTKTEQKCLNFYWRQICLKICFKMELKTWKNGG